MQVTINQKSTKTQEAFLHAEGENIVFLSSRVLHLCACNEMRNDIKILISKLLHFANKKPHLFNMNEPAMQIVIADMGLPSNPIISSYDQEFPKDVLIQKNLHKATRVFVAQGLAIWSFYNQNKNKLAEVIAVGFTRLQMEPLDNFKLHFKPQDENKLTSKSEFLIYFTTHIVLIATMWGQLSMPCGGLKSQWQFIIKHMHCWIYCLENKAKENLEIWIELMFCLDLLRQKEIIYQYESKTNKLFVLNFEKTASQHCIYHTFVLWAHFYCLRHCRTFAVRTLTISNKRKKEN